jgi:hypothetical protein
MNSRRRVNSTVGRNNSNSRGHVKKIVLLISLGFIVVVVLVGVSLAWLQRDVVPPADAMLQPPCGSTSRSEKSASKCSELSDPAILTVAFCDLLHDEARYKNKIVRTEAKLYGDSGDFGLGDPSCSGPKMGARVDFDSTYGIGADAQKAFDDLLCLPRRYYADKEADVTVVGRFDGLDGKPGDRYRTFQFTVMCVQRAQNQRLKYGGT